MLTKMLSLLEFFISVVSWVETAVQVCSNNITSLRKGGFKIYLYHCVIEKQALFGQKFFEGSFERL